MSEIDNLLHLHTYEKRKPGAKAEEKLYCLCVRWSNKVQGVLSHKWERWSRQASMQLTLDAHVKLSGTRGAKRDFDFAIFSVEKSRFKLIKFLKQKES